MSKLPDIIARNPTVYISKSIRNYIYIQSDPCDCAMCGGCEPARLDNHVRINSALIGDRLRLFSSCGWREVFTRIRCLRSMLGILTFDADNTLLCDG